MPLRLLQVVGGAADPASGVTGVERVAQTLVAGLDFAHYVAYPESGALASWFRSRTRAVLSAMPQRRFDRAWVRQLGAFIEAHGIDVVLSHGLRYDFLASRACRPRGVPHVVSRPAPLAGEATMPALRKFLYGIVDTWTLHVCTGIVTVSEASRRRLRATQGVATQRITVIPNGIRIPQVSAAERAAARRSLGVADDATLLGAAGRLVAGKGFDQLLLAVARLRPAPAPVLTILGEGPERARLQDLAQAHGLRLHLPGYVAEPAPLLAAFDLAALPSKAEGLPLSLLETMALGVPPVATRVGGIPELIVHDECGLLVPVGDVGALAGALGRLLSDADLRRRLGAAASRRIRDHFSLETMLQTFSLYLRSLNPASSARPVG